mmetsp:Transcript_20347/g.24653  ORF Transcript_20347/g.24653 Transcript_20347/m.24653 type:complete len:277 (-) Transcript_20347:820-1650(-)|eukprot:CAMPEP_0204887310 /NCGR_PEP_ID=MMETSP1349-20130617/17485_1 /ASSEMBLY_ACC=CAM_ASM_000710 /TAXON_ID=215587 /ORGANISM="Aplanochytrium stocchinoi, Strain GSBS06" /LENGTH=276 /DNA_ID=CAMNT_0052049977 /DNA_START=77 /DNA_END=907 /DNA_ORIENTATION=+
MAKNGATIIMACRTKKSAEKVQLEIINESGNRNIHLELVDLSDQQSVNTFTDTINKKYDRLDILINNAGVMLPSRKEVKNIDGVSVEMMLQVNFLAVFVLNLKLLPLLRRSKSARIVNVGSSTHRISAKLCGGFNFSDPMSKQHYEMFTSYGNSKLANHMCALELSRRLRENGETNITVNSLNPGTIPSGITRHLGLFLAYGHLLIQPINKTVVSGAYTTITVATSPKLEGITGKWFEHGVEVPCASAANNIEDAKTVWALAEELTGISSKTIIGI